jgi:hypothetical protein
VGKDVFFAVAHWYPRLKGAELGTANLFNCRATVRVPSGYAMAAAKLIKQEAGASVFLWESLAPVDSVPLCVGRFRQYTETYRDIPLSFCAFNVDEAYARHILKEAALVLAEFEKWFGHYPQRQLAIVEYPYQSAGGMAQPSVVTLNPERLVPEHRQRMLDGYIPHELAHSWWGSALPPWLGEGGAVFANYMYLEQTRGKAEAAHFLDREFYEVYFKSGADPKPLLQTLGLPMYTKAGYFLSMLDLHLGREAMIELMREYLESNARPGPIPDETARTTAFLNLLKNAAGPELHAFIDDWTGSVKKFDPAIVSFQQSTNESGFEQILDLSHDAEIKAPVPFRLRFTNGSFQDAMWDGSSERVTTRTKAAVVSAELDPERRLLDWDRGNNKAKPGARAVRPKNQITQSKGWRTYTQSDGLPGLDARCLFQARDGSLFSSFYSFQAALERKWALASFSDGQWAPYSPKSMPIHLVNAMAQARDGTWWFASQNHLRRMRGDEASDYRIADMRKGGVVGDRNFAPNKESTIAIPGASIYSLRVDSDDRLWVGTDKGVTILDQNAIVIRTYGPPDGLGGTEVFSVAQDRLGVIWAATDKGLFSFAENRWSTRGKKGDLALSVAAAEDGTIWCGTFRSGLIEVNGGHVRTHSHLNAPVPDTIFSSVAVDKKGALWAGTPNGLIHYDGLNWKHYRQANSGLPVNRINYLHCDPAGNVWMGTSAGLTRFNPEGRKGQIESTSELSPLVVETPPGLGRQWF